MIGPNLSEWALKKRSLVVFLMILAVVAGTMSFLRLGRGEDPAFTVRIEGWTDEESRPLLQYLYQHAARPEFAYRFQWRAGSVAFWDNRCTWHYALNDYHGQRRLLHRITVEGVRLA